MIANCPVSVTDINHAEAVFGPSVPVSKGKTARSAPDAIMQDCVAVPPKMLQANQDVALSGDIFFVNKIPFFAAVSDHIKFTAAQCLQSHKHVDVVPALVKVKNICAAHGFNPKHVFLDGEFANMQDGMHNLNMQLNTAAANEHVPKMECQIHVIKEHTHCIHHTLPFKCIPILMMIEMVYCSVLWLNAFPPKGGASDAMSPYSIITGVPFDFEKHCKHAFGTCGQAHEDATSNSQIAHAIGTICLGPTGNIQGSQDCTRQTSCLHPGHCCTLGCMFTPAFQHLLTQSVCKLAHQDGSCTPLMTEIAQD